MLNLSKKLKLIPLFILVLMLVGIPFGGAVQAEEGLLQPLSYISADTTWTLTNSPYIIDSSLLVEEGKTLTIEPGVVVKFNTGKGMQVDGCLIARGTEENPITFTSNKASPAPGDWVNILFTDPAIDTVYDESENYSNGCILQHCIVEYGGGSSLPAISATSMSLLMDNCNIHSNKSQAINVEESSNFRIISSKISDNSGIGIYISYSFTVIKGNTISRNSREGIIISTNEELVSIENNMIESNGERGIYISTREGVVDIHENTISSNKDGGVYFTRAYSPCSIKSNIISNNIASVGGGILIEDSSVFVERNIISNNSAAEGSGIFFEGNKDDEDSVIRYNIIKENISTKTIDGAIRISGNIECSFNEIYSNVPFDFFNAMLQGSPHIDATNNWWGTADNKTIEAHIYDWFDDASLGIVDYSPYLNSVFDPPSVPVAAVSDITSNSTTLIGILSETGTEIPVSVSFEYGLTTEYGNSIAGVPPTLSEQGTFTAVLSDLTPNTRYHFRAVVHSLDIIYGEDQTFTTLPSSDQMVSTIPANDITETSAILDGCLTYPGLGTNLSVCFEWGTSNNYGNTTTPEVINLDSPQPSFQTQLLVTRYGNLGNNYKIAVSRISSDFLTIALNTYGISFVPISMSPSEIAKGLDHGVIDGVLINNHPSSALTDMIESGDLKLLPWSNQAISAVVQAYPNELVPSYLPPNTYNGQSQPIPGYTVFNQPFSAVLTDLSPGQTYHFRAKAIGNETVYGGDQTFVTQNSLIISTTSLPDWDKGIPFSESLTATGGVTPYIWSLKNGTLPVGLTLDKSSGLISGTPTTAKTYNFTVQVTDSAASKAAATQPLSITINPALKITTASLVAGKTGEAYSQNFSAEGGSGDYLWSLKSGTLPEGLNLDEDGRLSGTPAHAGTFSFSPEVDDGIASVISAKPLILNIYAPLAITPVVLPDGGVKAAYSASFTATGGIGPYSWSKSGNWPKGLTLSSKGVVSGKPTRPGTYDFTVKVTDKARNTASETFSIKVNSAVTLASSSLTTGEVNIPYSWIPVASGGDGQYTWSYKGTLPSGLTFDNTTGVISGTPTTDVKNAAITVKVTDGLGGFASKALKLKVYKAVTITTASLKDGKAGTSYSVTLKAKDGSGKYNWSLAEGSNSLPEWASLNLKTGVISTLSGSKPTAGTWKFSVMVKDTLGGTNIKSFTITIK
jgi:parallel beta-helix repeat protein